MHYLSEFIGMLIIIMIGNGVGYFVLRQNIKSKYYSVFAWGFAVFIAIIISLYMGGKAHLNPVVTLANMFLGNVSISVGLAYIALQIAGAMVGQLILNAVFKRIFLEKPIESYANHATKKVSKLHKAFINEFVGTTILILVAVVALSHLNTSKDTHHFVVAIVVGLTVSFIGTFFDKWSPWAINPARDLGPKIIYVLTYKIMKLNGSVYKDAYISYSWLPIVAPMCASVFGLLNFI